MKDGSEAATTDAAEPTAPRTNLASPPARQSRWSYVAWWVKLFVQPILFAGVIVGIVALIGWLQYLAGESGTLAEGEVATDGEGAEYICPMLCVPPVSEPGDCPVCGMRLKKRISSGDSSDRLGMRIDPVARRVANIQTVPVAVAPVTRQIRAIGEIGFDEGRVATISAYVSGRLEELFANFVGFEVEEDANLALLYSPDLLSAQAALIEAAKLSRNTPRLGSRLDDTQSVLVDSARRRLIELGLSEAQVAEIESSGEIRRSLTIPSPISGTVVEKMVVKGDFVSKGDVMFRVADLSRVWLNLELFPEDASVIRYGQRVTTRIRSIPDREFLGRVAFVEPVIDTETSTIRVRVVIPNEEGLIKIGDFARATIEVALDPSGGPAANIYDPLLAEKWISPRHPHVVLDEPGPCPECGVDLVPATELGFASTPSDSPGAMVVPRDAILSVGDHSVAYVETESGRFEFREVTTGPIVAGGITVLTGLEVGESIARSANFLLDSEFNMSERPSLIDPNRATPLPPAAEPVPPEVLADLAKLSDEDRKRAEWQRICPVTDELLGSMGVPPKVDVEGTDVFICCEGCRSRLLENPAEFLAKLPKDPQP